MRFHSRYPLLQCWTGPKLELVRRGMLSVARLEPVVGDAVSGGGVLDLVFSDGVRTAVVPFIRVEPYALLQRERTPLVWPTAMRALRPDVLLEIEREVLPWLQSLALARQQNAEVIRTFAGSEARDLFDAARSAGLLGAARYDELLAPLAPYVYAARFCEQRSVAIVDDCGANGAAVLCGRVSRVRADLKSDERNALASAWFGASIFGKVSGTYDVVAAPHDCVVEACGVRITLDAQDENARVVSVASAVPLDVMVSFDPEDAPVARTFSVRSNLQHELRNVQEQQVAAVAGGSSGAILLLMREDFERAPDADVDEAHGLASRLKAEGFDVELRTPSTVDERSRPDLVHAFTVAGSAVESTLAGMRAAGVPIVASPTIGPAPQEAAWGPDVVSAAYARSGDDGVLAEFLDLITLRKLTTEGATPAPPRLAALRHVDAALVTSEAELRLLRDHLGFAGDAVSYAPAVSNTSHRPADIASLVGAGQFVLIHAPVDWRTNLPLVACAAAQERIPLVIAGPMVNFLCFRHAAQLAPEFLVHVPKADEAELDALYRAARVYADVSWGPQGYGRLARAAVSGCRLVVSGASFAGSLWPGSAVADPASPASILTALRHAWNAPEPPPPAPGPDLFAASIFAYSKAIAARQPA